MPRRSTITPPTTGYPRLTGLIAAPFTPFDRHGDVNLAVVREQAELLARNNVRGAYVCGTTGEGVSCSVAERKAVMEEWVRRGKGRLSIIAHVGALSIRDSQDLAAHAQQIGADAISIVAPNFFKPASIEALIAHINAVVAAAPRVPFYYYHSVMSGVDLPMAKFLEAADGRIPTLAGLKFNSNDLYEFQNCLRACGGKYDVAWGVDESLAGAIALGARSAVGSTYNYAAPLFHRVWKAMEAGRLEEARAGMAKACRIVDILGQYGGIAAGKAMMAIHGIDVGDPRPPLRPLTPGERADIVLRLKNILS